jgi:predicted thioredoxin/glutaredoxin
MNKMKVVDAHLLGRYFGTMLFTFTIGVICGMFWMMEEHPYDRCILKYDVPEDILECVWLISEGKKPTVTVGVQQ